MELPSHSVTKKQAEVFGKNLVFRDEPTGFYLLAQKIASAATRAMKREDENASLILISDAQNSDPEAGFLRYVRTTLSMGRLYAPLFNKEINSSYDNPGDPHHSTVPRIRLAHQIDPKDYRDLFPDMVESWNQLGCFVVMSSREPLAAFVCAPGEHRQTSHPVEILRNAGRVLELTMPEVPR